LARRSENLASVPTTSGHTARRGVHLIAAYRDDEGACHLSSATCTHLRGVVQWNASEKTWDCPCHGSRFDPYGRVLNGPAPTNLAPLEAPGEATGEVPAEAPASGRPREAPAAGRSAGVVPKVPG
jgi:Rieske Fe-S protein